MMKYISFPVLIILRDVSLAMRIIIMISLAAERKLRQGRLKQVMAEMNSIKVNLIDPWGLATLGIHSTGSHSWISYTDDDGKTTTYGLWHKSHSKPVTRVRPDSDVHKNKEPHTGTANRYYNNLTKKQEKKLQEEINKKQKYRYPTNNCSSYASDTAEKVTGEDVDADSWFGVETPRELMENIKEKEKKDPTKNESLKKS
ncbi:MAG: hypothetical protein BWY69_00306 [Planctomycetes bacterium ADurb.Bin401]|nr:MAG: hypothetical protein BWY69_00306 [Planctomycetes bacterium ADurb.Bin401]